MLGTADEIWGLLTLTFLVLIPLSLALLALLDLVKVRLLHTSRRRWLARAALVGNAALLLCAADAWLIEPRMLTVTRISAVSPKVAPQTNALKIVHISDVHFVRRTPLTERILRTIQHEKPDLLFVTGDIQQIGRYDRVQFRDFMSRLCSVTRTYIVLTYDDEALVRQACAEHAWILGRQVETANIRGTQVSVGGRDVARPWLRRAVPKTNLLIMLVHTPDELRLAARFGADWCFAGHTHGGQVRLPIWGAIVTASSTGKRYEYGRYRIGAMDAFVTRGIGLEPPPAPQVRFLCPPEIVVLTLTRENPSRR